MELTRRSFIEALFGAGAILRMPFTFLSRPENNRPDGGCDVCGVPESASETISYCIRCSVNVHPRCSGSISCQPETDDDWREMFHTAAEDFIDRAHGHELISPGIEVVFE